MANTTSCGKRGTETAPEKKNPTAGTTSVAGTRGNIDVTINLV